MNKRHYFKAFLLLTMWCSMSPNAWAQAVDANTQSITLVMAQEPPSLDSTLSTDQVSFFILGHVSEGLLRYDKRGRLTGGVAEKWELRPDGATFWLRKDARWSDGKPVTAHDFVFAWQTLVDPQIASEYASIAFPIKNAEAVNRGKLPRQQLGAVATDDFTLEVTLEKTTAYFLELMAFGVFNPVREDFYTSRGDRYAAEYTDLLYNGPFKITKWIHGAKLTLEKNEHYWNRDKIRLNKIDMPYFTSDSSTAVNLFKDGKIAYVGGISSEVLKDVLKEKIKIKTFLTGSVFYVEFNYRDDRITRNRNFRKAIQSVFDAEQFTNKIIATPGAKPGASLFPLWINGVEKRFRQEYPAPKVPVDVNKGRQYLAAAKKDLGLDAFPPLVLLTGDSPTAAKQAEYFQNLLSTTLGLDLKIDKQIFKQRLAKMSAGDFDMVMAGWGPDYNDIMTFADLFASWNINNRGRYSNPEYDRLIRVAQDSTDPKVRMDAMAKIQQIVIDDVTILPQVESSSVYIQSPKLKGVIRRVIGSDPDFTFARVVE